MSHIKRTSLVAMTDVIRAAEQWADGRRHQPLTEADAALMGAVMRWRSIRDRKPSEPPMAGPPTAKRPWTPLTPEGGPRFDPEAPTEPSRPGLAKTRPGGDGESA